MIEGELLGAIIGLIIAITTNKLTLAIINKLFDKFKRKFINSPKISKHQILWFSEDCENLISPKYIH